jgi:fatty-acyl-CoA synthase
MIDFPRRSGVPQCTLADYETHFADRHRVQGTLTKWAAEKPDAAAVLNADTGRSLTWRELDRASTALAIHLLEAGFRKGDFFAASLPLLNEHIVLEYACFKIGVVHVPLDLRLPPGEVLRCLALLGPRGFAFLGATPAADFRELGRAVMANCPSVEYFLQFSAPEETIPGADCASRLASTLAARTPSPELLALYRAAAAEVRETDGAQVIFTTGSTGLPKPALLSHRSITSQNLCLGAAGEFTERTRMLLNLPASHVGGQSEILMTTLFWGGLVITLHVFDPARSLGAIEEHRVNKLGQIPAMFNLEWRLSSYRDFDLSSLELAVCGGQPVSRQFLESLATMAPRFGTGLGLTEASGFCTYTAMTADMDAVAGTLGFDMPAYPMSIRAPMKVDGAAGDELPDGEIGHVCFQGPQTFLGYVGDPAATARTLSTDGVLYTGDMGLRDARGLRLIGRAKWIMKPAGYQVFPGQVEDHFAALSEKVAACGVVSVDHAIFSEGIVAFVEKRPGADLSVAELRRHARKLASYMRPLHYVVLEPGTLPLNRVVKTDYVRLAEMARQEVERLRARRRWDR